MHHVHYCICTVLLHSQHRQVTAPHRLPTLGILQLRIYTQLPVRLSPLPHPERKPKRLQPWDSLHSIPCLSSTFVTYHGTVHQEILAWISFWLQYWQSDNICQYSLLPKSCISYKDASVHNLRFCGTYSEIDGRTQWLCLQGYYNLLSLLYTLWQWMQYAHLGPHNIAIVRVRVK